MLACGGADAGSRRIAKIRPELGREAKEFLNREAVVLSTWAYFARRALKDKDVHLLSSL